MELGVKMAKDTQNAELSKRKARIFSYRKSKCELLCKFKMNDNDNQLKLTTSLLQIADVIKAGNHLK